MTVRKIIPDADSFTLHVPLYILPGLNADFDGDVINQIGIMSDEVAYAFRKFDPIDRMIISRDSGKINGYFMNTKDQLLTIREFARM